MCPIQLGGCGDDQTSSRNRFAKIPLQNKHFNKHIFFRNPSLRIYIALSWSERFGRKSSWGYQCPHQYFMKEWAGLDLDHFLIDRTPESPQRDDDKFGNLIVIFQFSAESSSTVRPPITMKLLTAAILLIAGSSTILTDNLITAQQVTIFKITLVRSCIDTCIQIQSQSKLESRNWIF